MRKLGWYAVSAVVAAIILGGVLLLAANLYVQSTAVQALIRQALVSNLKMPVELKKTTVTPWEGVRLDGITMRSENTPDNFLTAASFRVQFALLPLFHRRLVVESILLDQPEVAWAQNAEGRWQYPPDGTTKSPGKKRGKRFAPGAETSPVAPPAEAPPAVFPTETSPAEAPPTDGTPVAAAQAGSPEPVSPPPVATPLPPPETPEPPREKRPSLKRLAVAIDKLKLRHGILNFLDSQRRPVGRFDDVNLNSVINAEDQAVGTLWFDKASLPRTGLVIEDFHSNFTYGEDGLALRDGNGSLAGGKIQLDYRVETAKPGSPFAATCRVENVSIDTLITQAGGRPKLAEGSLQGDIKATGHTDDPDTRHATGQIRMTDARFMDIPILQTIGQALQIQDVSHLQFKKAQLDYTLDGEVLHVVPLTMVSNDLQIDAQGDYHLDRDRLNLRARLTIDQAVSRQLPDFIESNFQPAGDDAPRGSRYMDFDISGSLEKPKSDLFAKVLSGSAGSLLQSFFGSKKKHDKKPKHEESASPSPSDQNGNGSGNDQ